MDLPVSTLYIVRKLKNKKVPRENPTLNFVRSKLSTLCNVNTIVLQYNNVEGTSVVAQLDSFQIINYFQSIKCINWKSFAISWFDILK